MEDICADSYHSDNIVRKWVSDSKEGRLDKKDEHFAQANQDAQPLIKIHCVEDLVTSDRKLTVDEISEYLELSHGRVDKILSNELRLKKIYLR